MIVLCSSCGEKHSGINTSDLSGSVFVCPNCGSGLKIFRCGSCGSSYTIKLEGISPDIYSFSCRRCASRIVVNIAERDFSYSLRGLPRSERKKFVPSPSRSEEAAKKVPAKKRTYSVSRDVKLSMALFYAGLLSSASAAVSIILLMFFLRMGAVSTAGVLLAGVIALFPAVFVTMLAGGSLSAGGFRRLAMPPAKSILKTAAVSLAVVFLPAASFLAFALLPSAAAPALFAAALIPIYIIAVIIVISVNIVFWLYPAVLSAGHVRPLSFIASSWAAAAAYSVLISVVGFVILAAVLRIAWFIYSAAGTAAAFLAGYLLITIAASLCYLMVKIAYINIVNNSRSSY